jgi:arsenate reductase
MKHVLVLCTGNSCRSILAEALLNRDLGPRGLQAWSSGTAPKSAPNPRALACLERQGFEVSGYRSKPLSEVMVRPYDLVVTVCDNAKEACPVFPGKTRVIHEGFEDPDGQPEAAFDACFEEIRTRLLPRVAKELGL